MPSLKINELEQAALFGLPHLSIALYVIALRPRMNYATGLVGSGVLISWRAVCEWLYVEPHPGVRRGPVSQSAARRATEWLIKAGLIKMRSNGAQRHLIFECVMADKGSFKPKQADSKPTGQADRPPHREKPPQADRPRQAEADKHPVSGSFNIRSTTTTFTVSKADGEKSSAAHRADETPDAAQAPLELWRGLSPTHRNSFESVIRQAPSHLQQAVADEVSAVFKRGVEPSRPLAWVNGIVKRAVEGRFRLDAGLAIADARLARQSASTQAVEAPGGTLSPENKEKLAQLTARIGRRKGGA
jgi:hypothetical protein